MSQGLLLLNLGTPEGPEPEPVGRYLKEFLMDPLVIDIPWAARWFLIHVLIVPKRKFASSAQYKTIWTERGSPLLFHLRDLAEAVAPLLSDTQVEIAMRYGEPSIARALKSFVDREVTDVTVFSLYPQYAESSTRSSVEACRREAARVAPSLNLVVAPSFYEAPAFIEPSAAIVKKYLLAEKPDHLLMSFHSLPERHILRTDRSGGRHCLKPGCCDRIVDANRDCYRAQSFATARAIAIACGLAPDEYTVAFQSRLGRAEWIKPATEATIERLGREGVKKLAVVCPSFVADCLETIEEIGVRAQEVFTRAGGEKIIRIPCLNADPAWARGIAKLAREAAPS